MDWYRVDVYYEGEGPDSNCTHPDLDTYDLVSQYMDGFLSIAQDRSGLAWPQINVCECNANAPQDAHVFLDPAGSHSVTWEYVVDAAVPYTINALNSIQGSYG